ncbi:MAG: class F sortase [Nocardioidaceae bacterium]
MTAVGSRRGALTALALVAATVGLILIVTAVLAQVRAPQPPRAVGQIDAEHTGSASASAVPPSVASTPGATGKRPLLASLPTRITVPAIGVDSKVLPIGLAPDRTLAVPQPGPNLNRAAWFKNSPTPGQPGPAIIEGHVDSDQGPSVFFKLGQLRPGDTIHVFRKDGIEVVFTVNAVRDYKKSEFPTEVVYGAAGEDPVQPLLRLITCSDFDASIGTHTGNEVVFAHLTATHHKGARSTH